MLTDNLTWLNENYARILQSLKWLEKEPIGPIYKIKTELHDILIEKIGTQIRLKFLDPVASEIISRIDIAQPLNLLAPYTRGLMLGLVWVAIPRKVYVIGFGGGRLPMLLHHYFPTVEIESTDIEPAITDIATKFFGIEFDHRLKLAIQDGREYLEQRDTKINYDIIMLDGFRGIGYGPYSLSTLGFYNLCKQHLNRNGVVLANMLSGDQLYFEKVLTFKEAFTHTYLFSNNDQNVLIGTDVPLLAPGEILKRAKKLQELHHFEFPIIEEALHIIDLEKLVSKLPEFGKAIILTDTNPPQGYFDSLSANSSIFANAQRNKPCPCGSGKAFENCHGRLQSSGL